MQMKTGFRNMADKSNKSGVRPVPTLSKKQIKKTLGNKKKVIRNTLLNPHVCYWPVLSESENKALFNEIQRYPKMDQVKKEKKKSMLKCNLWRESTERGINSVSRSIQRQRIASVLVADDVNPKSLVQHIIAMCVAKEVPVLVVTGLRNELKSAFGIPTAIMGLKDCVSGKNHAFYQLHTLIVKFAKLHKPPAHLLQFKKLAINTIKLEVASPKLVTSLKGESTCHPITFSTLHLKKTSTCKAFIPPSRRELNNIKSDVEHNSSADFISLGIDEIEEKRHFVYSEPLGISQNVLNPKKKRKKDLAKRKSGFPPPLEMKLNEAQKPQSSSVDSDSMPKSGRTDYTEVKLEAEDISCSGRTSDQPSEELGFISFGKDESEEECHYDSSKPIGISHTILNPRKRPKKQVGRYWQNYFPPHIPFKYARVQPKPKKEK